jgi:hypothetical protein
MVTFSGSPPKAAMFSCTHFSARIMSRVPKLPERSASPVPSPRSEACRSQPNGYDRELLAELGRWLADGGEWTLSPTPRDRLTACEARPQFDDPAWINLAGYSYQITADGTGFLVVRSEKELTTSEIRIVEGPQASGGSSPR